MAKRLFSAVVANRGGHWLGKNENEECRECRECREYRKCRGCGECRAAGHARFVCTTQDRGSSSEAALWKISRYIPVGRKVQPGQGVLEKLSDLALQEQCRPKRCTKDDGGRPCMNGRTVGSVMLPQRARMELRRRALSVIGALHCLRVREISHTPLRATFRSFRSLSLACYTVPE
jgi:hypothetical protein